MSTQKTDGTFKFLNKKLPACSLLDHNENKIKSSELMEQNDTFVLFFYPKDNTPGCTKEACGFRDFKSKFTRAGAKIFGISPDNAKSHLKFIDKFSLNFDLLVDTDHKLAEKLSIWKEKKFMGKNYMGIERTTLLIKNSKIVHIWQPVRVKNHVEAVLEKVKELKS